MLPVSNAYRESMKNIVRNRSYEKIILNIFNVQAMADLQISATDQDSLSNLSELTDGKEPKTQSAYATLEPYRFVLDGSQKHIPDNTEDYANLGYVSSSLSDENCEWSTSPSITLTFGKDYDFAGLTFFGDLETGDYISELQIIGYQHDGTIGLTENVYPDNVIYVWRHSLNHIKTILVKCLKSSAPYRRARFRKIHLGLIRIFDNRVISKTSEKNEIDPLMRRLPTETFSCSIYDLEHEYDPDNKSGLWPYIFEKQPIIDCKGYELDDGSIYWLDPTYYRLSGNPSWKGWTVSFAAEKILSTLNDSWKSSLVPDNPVSLGELAEAILKDALSDNSALWDIDPKLYQLKTSAALPTMPHREALQLIAQAGNCRLFTDRNGVVTLKSGWYPTQVQALNIDLNAQKKYPEVEVIPPLSVENIVFYSNFVAGEDSLLIDTTLEIHGTERVWVDYSCAKNPTAVVTNGTLIESEMYAYGGYLTITGDGEVSIKISGKEVTQTNSSIPYVVDAFIVGDTDTVENMLITDLETKKNFERSRAKYLSNRNTYSLSYRGNPEIECGDAILFETNYEKNMVGVVLSHELNFNGSLSGTLVLKRINNFGNQIYTNEIYAGETIGVI